MLRKLGDDLRSAVLYQPIDMQGLLASSVTGDTEALSEALLETATAAGMGEEAAAAAEGASESSTQSQAASVVPQTVPGLYGDAYGLQVDVSRLPRMDQYNGITPDSEVSVRDLVSDVKTVAYFVAQPGELTSPDLGFGTGDTSLASGGLIRRELDRSVTAWAANNGNLDALDSSGQLLSPDVVEIRFIYFDGTEWVDTWNSEERKGLPVAVDISLTFGPSTTLNAAEEVLFTNTPVQATDPNDFTTYRLLVHLPTAQATTIETTESGNPVTEPEPTTESSTPPTTPPIP